MRMFKRFTVILAALLLLVMAVPAAFAATNRETDTTKLLDLMAVAEKLRQEDYTAQSWASLDSAMTLARSAVENGSQNEVDSAARQVATAFSQMIRMDFSALNAVLAEAEEWSQTDENVDALWDTLMAQLKQLESARKSGDQDAVDQLAAQMDRTLEQLKAKTNGSGNGTVWMILFIISLLMNVGFVVLVRVRNRHMERVQKDDVPLVDYDIDDDLG